jgi:CheY-like chemotaxis protein
MAAEITQENDRDARSPARPRLRQTSAAAPAVLGKLHGKVLVAEDTDDLRELAVLYLKSLGIAVSEAENGQEAVMLALRDRPDAILMDLEMPILGGLDAARQLRRQGFGGLILAMTGHLAASVRAQTLAAGINDVLSKPVSRAQLHGALAGVCKV